MSTNAAMFGSIATEAMLKQKLDASKKVPPASKEVFIQRPGTPIDGLRATLKGSYEGEAIVALADGTVVSVPSIYLVAAPDTTEKTEKVTPNDKPASRGNAAAEEDATDRAKKNSTTIEKPPVLEHLKTGPKSVRKENAQTAPEAGEGLKVLLAAAEAAEESTKAAAAVAKEAATKVGEAKADEAKKVKAVVEEMEKTGLVVAKIKDRLIALDEKKNVAAVNIPKTGALRAKYDHALQVLELLQKNVKEHMDVIAQLKAEAEEQYGATYNVEKRVSLFPASMQASLKTAAGFADIVKGLLTWVKSIFGMAQDAEVKVGEFADEMEVAAKDVKEPVAAAAKVEAVGGVKASEDGKGDTEFVKHRGGKWVLLDKQGKDIGSHATREEAMSQLKAIEWHKHAASRIAARLLKSGRVTADAMEKEIFEGPGYFVEDNFGGGHFIPGDVLPKGEEGNAQNLARFCEAQGPIVEVEKIQGWWGRYQMPGYLDSTDWVFDEDKAAMEAELERVFGLDDEDADLDEEVTPEPKAEEKPKAEGEPKPEGDVEASFQAFQAALVARTGLTAADAGITDAKAFQASLGTQTADQWVAGFIQANGLRDLKPVKA